MAWIAGSSPAMTDVSRLAFDNTHLRVPRGGFRSGFLNLGPLLSSFPREIPRAAGVQKNASGSPNQAFVRTPAVATARPPSSRSRRGAPPPTWRKRLPALMASSWQRVVLPAGELDGGSPGRLGPSSLCVARLPEGLSSPRRSNRERVAGATSRSAFVTPHERALGQAGRHDDTGGGGVRGQLLFCTRTGTGGRRMHASIILTVILRPDRRIHAMTAHRVRLASFTGSPSLGLRPRRG
jgi:hypothetical protein